LTKTTNRIGQVGLDVLQERTLPPPVKPEDHRTRCASNQRRLERILNRLPPWISVPIPEPSAAPKIGPRGVNDKAIGRMIGATFLSTLTTAFTALVTPLTTLLTIFFKKAELRSAGGRVDAVCIRANNVTLWVFDAHVAQTLENTLFQGLVLFD
jgi:hypothetical protein